MVKKTGLGRGLGALIPDDFEEKLVTTEHQMIEVDIQKIKANALQPRKHFEEEQLRALAESIERNGVLQPIILRQLGDFYEIIAGERRWRASMMLKKTSIPAIIMDREEEARYEIALIENIQRVDLNPVEEAMAYQALIEKYEITQSEVSRMVGKSRTYITNMMRLLNLESAIRDLLVEGKLAVGHARPLVGLEPALQKSLTTKIIDEEMSVRQVEKLVKDALNPPKSKQKTEKNDPYIKDAEQKIAELIGTKVRIHHGRQKGKIEIEYYTEADLERIIGLIES